MRRISLKGSRKEIIMKKKFLYFAVMFSIGWFIYRF